jgi:hypothetical protein
MQWYACWRRVKVSRNRVETLERAEMVGTAALPTSTVILATMFFDQVEIGRTRRQTENAGGGPLEACRKPIRGQ